MAKHLYRSDHKWIERSRSVPTSIFLGDGKLGGRVHPCLLVLFMVTKMCARFQGTNVINILSTGFSVIAPTIWQLLDSNGGTKSFLGLVVAAFR